MLAIPEKSPLRIRLARQASSSETDPFLLAEIRFGTRNSASAENPSRITVALEPLGPDDSEWVETWRTDTPVTRGFSDDIGHAQTDQVLFGWILIDEDRFKGDMERATEYAYDRIFGFLRQQGFPWPLRIWNYFPDLHREVDGLDRYQSFCLGRHRALERVDLNARQLPAATAIGTHAPGLLIYFLAGRQAGEQIENPRQVSAFQYPRRYGPKSPSFSRATLKRWDDQAQLFISGTASIVGHESLHLQARDQLEEILANLRALICASGEPVAQLQGDPAALSMLKVYIRHPQDMPALREQLQESLGRPIPVIHLHGDICRPDLLVEIEGLYA